MSKGKRRPKQIIGKPPVQSRPNHRRDMAILVAVTLACFAPFAGKAFNIDDPLFLWTAKHIVADPLDPFGFKVNWAGTPNPMWLQTKNPPLVCYYLALASRFVGWREVGLHAFMLLPTIAAVLGAYQLARRFCHSALLAALICLFTPAFLASSTSVMCDVPMLALWVWAVVLWVRGLDDDRWPLLLASGALIAASALTKYYGIALIPLLAMYALIRLKRFGAWTACLLLPIALLAAYQLWSRAVYGVGLITNATVFAGNAREIYGVPLFERAVGGLAFTGGCLIAVLFFAPLIWSRKALAGGAITALLCALLLARLGEVGIYKLVDQAGTPSWAIIIQMAAFITAGLSVILLGGLDLWERRDADSALIVVWLLGTLVFAGAINWTVNARSILPAAPALGILIARRLKWCDRSSSALIARWAFAALIPAAVISLWVAWADCTLANAQRTASDLIHATYAAPGRTLRLQSHWGLQYYLTQFPEVVEMDSDRFICKRGDVVVISVNNVNRLGVPKNAFDACSPIRIPIHTGLAVMQTERCAGFYSDLFGPMPFVFGPVPDESFEIHIARFGFAIIGGKVYLDRDAPGAVRRVQ